ncbi:MAG TPA: DUF1059 domain-containing protein [Bryobacteraceae bacterium]|nr:DUF1059 domain-containing protein [Bryobacteraceae bacterium]
MAKAFKCRDAGMDCDFQTTGETIEEVLRKATAHAKNAHGQQQLSQETLGRMRQSIREVGGAASGAAAGASQL